ncbi:MAG: GNAT family N-acetyltransferase [Alphaproteobacteria bacterium]
MADTFNSLGQPVGAPVEDWTARPRPSAQPMFGRFCRLERLDPERHAAELHGAHRTARDASAWTYLPVGPFKTQAAYETFLRAEAAKSDPFHHAVIDAASGKAVGMAAFMRIDPANGVIEIGHVAFSPLLRQTSAATETIYLLLRRAFDELGYRRVEWKCDSLNSASRRAAERFGFHHEGVFRQAVVYKGRTRDTAWFSIIDRDWPANRTAFERWLSPDNFDAAGVQRRTLMDIRAHP